MNLKYFIPLSFLAGAMLWSAGCNKLHRIEGNNQVVTETRQVVSFNRVVNEGTFDVYIRHDSVFSVEVEAESNLIPHIRTLINGNTLVIDTRENLHNYFPMKVFVRTPFIDAAQLRGSGYMQLDSLETDNLDVEISGSGKITGEAFTNYLNATISGSGSMDLFVVTSTADTRISGSGDMDIVGEAFSATHTISGSGNIRAFNFVQNQTIAKISGSGSMYLNVSEMLDVTISGSGSVYYVGNPSTSIRITGSGSVIKQ